MKNESRVLHHLCWADDLHAMAGTMNHLTRMTNAIERVGMRWKEKSLTIVAGPFTEYKPGDVVEIVSSSGKRWVWRVVEGMEALGTWLDNRGSARRPACGTESPKPTPCSTRRRLCSAIPNCRSRGVLTPSSRRVPQRRSMFQGLRIRELGKLRRVLYLRRRPNECWADHMSGELPKRCERPQVL